MDRFINFYQLLSNQRGSNVALVYDKEGVTISLTYKELISLIDNYATIDKSSIAILAENNVETIIAMFAYAKSQKQIVLLNPLDDISTLKKQIIAADVDYIVGNSEIVDKLNDCLTLKKTPRNGNILFFTSGTTTSTKAVILTESSLCASAYNGGALLSLSEYDIMLSVSSFSHVFGFVCSLLWPLSFGASIVLTNDLKKIVNDINIYKPTVISLVPQMASFFAKNQLINKELKQVLIGAGPCSIDIINAFKVHNVKVSFGYGLTETSSGVAVSIGEDPFAMSICPDVDIFIASDSEILISSKTCLMKGYYHARKSTDEAIKNGYFHTGDLGSIDENGLLHILGRKKDTLVFSDGTKIYCPEYEEELSKFLPSLDFAISLINDNVALFIYDENGTNIDKKIREFNSSRTKSHRISQIIKIKNAIPRTKTGKIQRYLLREIEEDDYE